jgi:hypothetical protein
MRACARETRGAMALAKAYRNGGGGQRQAAIIEKMKSVKMAWLSKK